jgi:1,4-alpha-glucan branching enzyme
MTALSEKAILDLDSWLEPFLPAIVRRHQSFTQWKNTIQEHEGGYDSFTKGYLKFGLNVKEDGSILYREWAPNAREAVLIGDFSSS